MRSLALGTAVLDAEILFAKRQYIDIHGRVLSLKSWNVFGRERKVESVGV